jgi:hypothetical protein
MQLPGIKSREGKKEHWNAQNEKLVCSVRKTKRLGNAKQKCHTLKKYIQN